MVFWVELKYTLKLFYCLSNFNRYFKKLSLKIHIDMNMNISEANQEIEPLEIPKTNLRKYTIFHMLVYSFTLIVLLMLQSSLFVFSTKFLLDVAKLPASYASIVTLISRVIDLFSDPVCAYFINKSKISKYGKFKPW